ncbi:MAG TPA: Gfo/Idh/MocA family oxidoreductase [Vicinamibacterales bacterium]
MSKNFAMTGVAGFVAPRHLKAIKETGNRLVAAVDPHDAVGVLDRFWFNPRFFTEIERFDRHLEKLHRGPEAERVHYVSICSPNYLHDAHIRMALRSGADAICEKPLVINPWNLDALEEIERETGKRVYTVLQLRLHPDLIALKKRLDAEQASKPHQVSLTYITARGPWYDVSWKGREDRSGGLVTNIGIHFFDLLIWLFGAPKSTELHLRQEKRMGGWIALERADVSWFLSAESADLPFEPQPGVKTTFRSITVDGQEIEFSEGFTDLHTRVYEEVLAGRGFGITEARPSIELTAAIRQTPVAAAAKGARHPQIAKVS